METREKELIQSIKRYWGGTPLQGLSDQQIRQLLLILFAEKYYLVTGRSALQMAFQLVRGLTEAEMALHSLDANPPTTEEEEEEYLREEAALEIEDAMERIGWVLKGIDVYPVDPEEEEDAYPDPEDC